MSHIAVSQGPCFYEKVMGISGSTGYEYPGKLNSITVLFATFGVSREIQTAF